ncbi:prolyl 4-hydroxylase [Burkholderia lata]|uniref:Prolyl 4-hydroxylase n=2 Tax=Burkholderia lata (strain ATCC 17760 / DSM 23089 / LMG 22485 / NCIMB 9086 / R18194 / 383) TaxID=482957 RepID=A0A6P2UDA1_BURL3|nr:prolyl 4-hydroxylase [Burkholderia lata]
MTSPITRIAGMDWAGISTHLDIEGYAVLPGFLGEGAARDLARLTETMSTGQRAQLVSDDMGSGELLYFGTSLPAPLENLRTKLYSHLAVIANRWSEILGSGRRYPTEFDDFLEQNKRAGQARGQSHLNRLGAKDHVSLHQRNEGEQVFPLQIVALLSEPGADFSGGEFVMTEQRPRMQSRPMVLPLKLGDAAIITTSERPFKGAKGYYRVNLKHAISRVHRGQRIGMELTFHNAR